MAMADYLEHYVVSSDCLRSANLGTLRALTHTEVLPAALFSDQRVVTLVGFENDQNSKIVTALVQIQIVDNAYLTTTIEVRGEDFHAMMPTRIILAGAPSDIETLTGPPDPPLIPSFRTRMRTKPADVRRLADEWASGSSPVMATIAALDHLDVNGINRHKSFEKIHLELSTSGRKLKEAERDTLIDILLDAAVSATDLWDEWPVDLLSEIDFDDNDFDF